MISKVTRIALSSVLIFLGVKYTAGAVNQLDLMSVVKSYINPSPYIKENYIDPNEVNLNFPDKKRNLIHIYLESMENSYLSKELGGHMDDNLIPELTELMKEGVSFSHNNKYGGPQVTHGSEWTVASIVNMESGIPLKTNMTRNVYGAEEFLPGITNIGDILKEEGYNQKMVVGSDLDFAGKTKYYKTHGDYEIFDVETAKEEGLIPKDYEVWWGYEDDKLFEYAKKELLELADKGEPFNFRMETADTHFPDGYLSENAERKYDSQYANVIAYSSKKVVEFVRWIQEQPFYENTTIVITGDHLSMDTTFFESFDDNYERSVFNLIINGVAETENYKNREFAPFDMFPTILAAIGVDIEGERLALGTNLYSDKETLIERDGLNVVNENLERHSPFYKKEFMN